MDSVSIWYESCVHCFATIYWKYIIDACFTTAWMPNPFPLTWPHTHFLNIPIYLKKMKYTCNHDSFMILHQIILEMHSSDETNAKIIASLIMCGYFPLKTHPHLKKQKFLNNCKKCMLTFIQSRLNGSFMEYNNWIVFTLFYAVHM